MSYKYDTKHNSPNFTPARDAKAVFGQARTIKGITIHWWGDPKNKPSFASVRDYLCRKGGNTSAHVVVSGTGRQVACIVNYTDVAWHSGNAVGNATTIGIECDPRCRDEDYDVVAEVIADLWSVYGKLPLKKHSDWRATACPGKWDLKRLKKIAETKVSGKKFGQVTNKKSETKPAEKPPVKPSDPVVEKPSTVEPSPLPEVETPAPEKPVEEVPQTLPESPDELEAQTPAQTPVEAEKPAETTVTTPKPTVEGTIVAIIATIIAAVLAVVSLSNQ